MGGYVSVSGAEGLRSSAAEAMRDEETRAQPGGASKGPGAFNIDTGGCHRELYTGQTVIHMAALCTWIAKESRGRQMC